MDTFKKVFCEKINEEYSNGWFFISTARGFRGTLLHRFSRINILINQALDDEEKPKKKRRLELITKIVEECPYCLAYIEVASKLNELQRSSEEQASEILQGFSEKAKAIYIFHSLTGAIESKRVASPIHHEPTKTDFMWAEYIFGISGASEGNDNIDYQLIRKSLGYTSDELISATPFQRFGIPTDDTGIRYIDIQNRKIDCGIAIDLIERGITFSDMGKYISPETECTLWRRGLLTKENMDSYIRG